MARLLSVNMGRPREFAWHGTMVDTSVWKEPLGGRRLVRRLNVDGATHRVIWPVTAASTALYMSTKWILTATAKCMADGG
jgi:hypothetical protein